MIKDEVDELKELNSYLMLYRMMGYHETFIFRFPFYILYIEDIP